MPRLSDILGQDGAIGVLTRAISAEKLAQAYLFTGPSGSGKATTALALAGALNCLEAPGSGCLACTSCVKIGKDCHPDILRLAPQGAFIKIEQVRALETLLGYPPHEGRFRVVIIDGADQLNPYAANALLKSVEEPRPSTLFILVSSMLHRVAPTLVSRCQRVRFLPLDSQATLAILKLQCPEHDLTQQHAAAALAEGSASRALNLVKGDSMATMQQVLRTLIDASLQRGVQPVFDAAADVGKDRLFLIEVLDLLRACLRDLLLVSEGLSEQPLLLQHLLPRLYNQEQPVHHPVILKQLRAVDETQAALRGNVHPALALENLVFRFRQGSCA